MKCIGDLPDWTNRTGDIRCMRTGHQSSLTRK